MTLKQIAALGRKLSLFLGLFADCFGRCEGRKLLFVYVRGQLSDLHRKTAEGIALRFKTAPRTLQRFLESIKWDEEKLRNRCQQIVAKDHAHPEAIGCVDESGTAKSGKETVGAGRQWNGNRGKVDNCVVGVHLSYSAPGFQVLLDSDLYLPKAWVNDPARRKKLMFRTRSNTVRNPKSHWPRSTAHCSTEYASRHGRSMRCIPTTLCFSWAWSLDGKCLSVRYKPIPMAGYENQESRKRARASSENGAARRSTHEQLILPARSAIC